MLCWKIAKEEGEIIASSLAYMTPNDESQVYFTTPYTKDNMEGYTTSIFAYHLEKAKEKGAIEVNVFLPQNRIKDAPLFEKLGFKFSQIKMYEKKL